MKTIAIATRTAIIADLIEMKASEIVSIFNAYVEEGKEVKRFSDRNTAEKRLVALLNSLPAPVEVEEEKAEVIADDVKSEAPKSLSASIAKSWNDPVIAEKRLTRNGVIAYVGEEAVEFKSLRAAFASLGLPDSKHIAFRQILKAEKKATFTFGKTSVNFELV